MFDYTARMDRFTARKDGEWNIFSRTVLAVVVAIDRSQTRRERYIVHQHESPIEVNKVLGIFMISFTSKDITSYLQSSVIS